MQEQGYIPVPRGPPMYNLPMRGTNDIRSSVLFRVSTTS